MASLIEPDLPHDPLAPSGGVDWAVERYKAVRDLEVDGRVRALLDALSELDMLLEEAGEEALTHELIDESEIEIIDDDGDSAVDAFIKAERADRAKMASMETIVLSGPEVKRKIRYKQSIMPSHMASNLYDDVRALFEIGDREGALISLERLIVVAPIAPEIEGFLGHNEARLLDYYQNVFGPFSRTIRMAEDKGQMPPSYFSQEKVQTVLDMIDGSRTVSEIIDGSGLRRIETCAVLSQLVRASAVDVGVVD
jgi:hypothetical protein